MKLSKDFQLPTDTYASQGNTDLGIRGSGKTWTASKCAEDLLDNKIPIVVFDPIGVWRNLRNGINGHPGYEIIIASADDGDVILTPDNAQQLIQLAMETGVSIIFDLYSVKFTKSDWRKIVTTVVMELLYKNKGFGQRHIFIEEAAEFVPQRVGPEMGIVYSAIERLARMGRNARLGYTLINQRAEEINKAVFEICERVLLHRQVGKNSLKSVENWLAVREEPKAKEIMKSLPRLENGECWVIDNTGADFIKVGEKKTLHPSEKDDHRHLIVDLKRSGGIKTFLEMAEMGRVVDVLDKEPEKKELKPSPELEMLRKKALFLEEENDTLKKQLTRYSKRLMEIEELCRLPYDEFHIKENMDIVDSEEKSKDQPIAGSRSYQKLGLSQPVLNPGYVNERSGEMRMLHAAAMFPKGISRNRMALIAGMKQSGTFNTYLSALRTKELIKDTENGFVITEAGKKIAGNVKKPGDLLELWVGIIGATSGAARMLRHLKKRNPEYINRKELAGAAGMTESGTFNTYLSLLRKANVIEEHKKKIRIARELVE